MHRGDRPFFGGRDPLLQGAHVGRQCRLIAHRRRDPAQQRRHFRAGLGEAEDIVDKEQHVLAFLVAEILGQGQPGQANPGTGARRLVHLTVDQSGFRAGRVAGCDDAGLDHFLVQIVPFAGPLADPGEHRVTAVRLGDVGDQFHDQHRFADAGAAEQANLAALGVRRQQVDDLNTGFQNFGFRRLINKLWRLPVNRRAHVGANFRAIVDRLTDDVQNPAQRFRANRHRDWRAGVLDLAAAHQTLGGVHGDGPHGVFAQMLRHLKDQRVIAVLRVQRVQDLRQIAVELHVDNGADDLGDRSNRIIRHSSRSIPSGLAPDFVSKMVRSKRLGAGDDFNQFFGDRRLTGSVVVESQAVDHVAGVARRAVHRGHARAMFTGVVFQHGAVDLGRDITRQ